jgi:protein involved in polysaccharide export with SLBB domain
MKPFVLILGACVLISLTCSSTADPVSSAAGGTPQTQFFSVAGEGVCSPGQFIFHDGITVSNAIKMAGGFVRFAQTNRVELRRKDWTKPLLVDVSRIERGLANDFKIQPGDRLYVQGPIVIRQEWKQQLRPPGTNQSTIKP